MEKQKKNLEKDMEKIIYKRRQDKCLNVRNVEE